MADQNELPSVVEFSEDVATQKQPDPLPKGTYPAEITSAVVKLSKAGNKYAEIGCKIDANNYPPDWTEGDPDGLVLYYRRVTLEDNPASRFRLKEFVKNAGLPAIGRELNIMDWLGRNVRVDVEPERGQDGLNYATIKTIKAN